MSNRIKFSLLPQTAPFRFLDEILESEAGERLVALKNATANEWIFPGVGQQVDHYPETLIIESAAQAVIVMGQNDPHRQMGPEIRYYIGKIKAEFYQQVRIGDQLRLEARMGRVIKNGGYADVVVTVSGVRVATVGLFFSVQAADNEESE